MTHATRFVADVAILVALALCVPVQAQTPEIVNAFAPETRLHAQQEPDGDRIQINVGDRQIALSASAWTPMTDTAPYARNFEAAADQPRSVSLAPRMFPQVLTFFLIQMSDDRRSGTEIAPGEYLTVFKVDADEVAVLLSRDHGDYWIHSRERFRVPGVSQFPVQTDFARGSLVITELRDEIDTTRHLLGQFIAR
jgi:hypothetical protein